MGSGSSMGSGRFGHPASDAFTPKRHRETVSVRTFQQGSAFSATRDPGGSGEGYAGHGRRLDAERGQVLGLQVVHV